MGKTPETSQRRAPIRPAIDPEMRENQLISLAVDLAEKQLREGTASSQVISHYLKLAAAKEKDKVELEILQRQKELISAKTEALHAQKRMDEMYANALSAMRSYSGSDEEEEYDAR